MKNNDDIVTKTIEVVATLAAITGIFWFTYLLIQSL